MKRLVIHFSWIALLLFSYLPNITHAGEDDIVINELHYHPETDFEPDEYIELHNHGNETVDLSNWAFTDGIFFSFPDGSLLDADDFLVVARNPLALESRVPQNKLYGPYDRVLNNAGEKVDISNADGIVIDSVTYKDHPPWPTTPDGEGPSLERISPTGPSHHPRNWGTASAQTEGQWQHLSTSGSVTNSRLYFTLEGSGALLIDDVSLIKKGTDENILANPNFEIPFSESNDWRPMGSHRNSERISLNDAVNGDHVLKLVSTGPQEPLISNSIMQTVENIELGENYRLSFSLKVLDAEGKLLVQTYGGGLSYTHNLEQPASLSPGKQNTLFSTNIPPYFSNVSWTPQCPAPNQEVTIEADIMDEEGIEEVTLTYLPKSQNIQYSEQTLPMKQSHGNDTEGRWTATIPGQQDHTFVRFYMTAKDSKGKQTIHPSPDEARYTYTYYHYSDEVESTIPLLYLYRFASTDKDAFRGKSAMVYCPPDENEWQVYDHVVCTDRKSGYNVFFLDHYEFNEMSSINIIFEPKPRYALAEWLSFQIYRDIGCMAGKAFHYRFFFNGSPQGYHLVFEQPNKNFISRNHLDNDGNNYKVHYNFDRSINEHNISRQYEKKTNLSTGKDDVIEMVTTLNTISGKDLTLYIESTLAVDEIIDYFVGCQLISDWDGYFNNHFVYHDMFGSGLWYVFPWDKDKTWGDSDAYQNILPYYDFYDFPILFGANGTPRSGKNHGTWWRPPGFISGPFLADPTIQNRYLHRLGYVAKNLFTPERWHPIINQLEEKLEPEVRYRADVKRLNEKNMLKQFHNDIESFRRQVIHRREFIIQEVEKRIGPVSVEDWHSYEIYE